jgi:hypothetical protein
MESAIADYMCSGVSVTHLDDHSRILCGKTIPKNTLDENANGL